MNVTKRQRAFALGATLALGVLPWASAARAAPDTVPAASPRGARPNIVFVLIDDAGFSDFGSYGSEIATPNIDTIAKSGVRFTNFHTASTCESSRMILHSGVDNHRAGAGTLQVTIADNQRGMPGYEGYLSGNVHSLGQLLHDGGYATYFAGKWNIGQGLARAPGTRGWDRYMSLENTGADNYEAKVYAPFNLEATWLEDGHVATLPKDFYSSRYYADKLIQFIDEGRQAGRQDKPFMALLSFQAVHSPLQAPDPDIEKYLHRYDSGWDRIRVERYERQVAMGLVPGGLTLPVSVHAKTWSGLSEADRGMYAKKMAVFAGMLDAADQEVGRLREHLRQIGQLDHTVFIVMSDNGADAYDLSQLNLPFKLWYRVNDKLGYDTLGQRGSYVHYGQDWAAVSNTPFRDFKGTSAEGGMRVPFIISYPGHTKPGGIANGFAYATDVLPTVLDVAGIPMPGDDYHGSRLIRPTGTSLIPYLEGRQPTIHTADETTGFEGTGGQALFKGDYKLMRNGLPVDDGGWHLYRIVDDPVEAHDLATQQPDRVQDMLADVQTYNARNGVVLPPPGYDPLQQLLKNNWPVLLRQLGGILAVAMMVVIGLVIASGYSWTRWRRRRTLSHVTR